MPFWKRTCTKESSRTHYREQGKLYNGIEEPTKAMEYWNDTWLTYKMLLDADFTPENIIVLFGDGRDANLYMTGLHQNYRPEDEETMTDFAATKTNVTNVFDGLRYGTNNMPRCNQDDFLYVYTFGEGVEYNTKVGINLQGQTMWNDEFAALVNPIAANKKVFMMAQGFSGGFAPNLTAPNTIFMSSKEGELFDIHFETADNHAEFKYAGYHFEVDVIENEVLNNKVYWHSEWNFHMFHAFYQQPLTIYYVNVMTTDTVFFTDADTNSDEITTFGEAHVWTQKHSNNHRVKNILIDPSGLAATTSLKYPTVVSSDIVEDTQLSGIIGFTNEVHVTRGNTLILNSKCKLICDITKTLIVDEGALLVIEDGSQILASATSRIVINGEISIGSDVTFDVDIDENSMNVSSLEFNNRYSDIFINDLTINKLKTTFNVGRISLNNCSFNESANITLNSKFVEVQNNTFNKSTLKATWMRAGGASGFSTAVVESNNFIGSGATAIDLSGYENYSVTGNTISGRINGIQLFHAGAGAANSQTIENNAITNCSEAALILYNTTGLVKNNHIENNNCGVKLLNGSNVSMVGNSEDADIFDTQLIKDNTTHQVYATEFSFPWYIKFNAIIDDVNTVPLVQYDRPKR